MMPSNRRLITYLLVYLAIAQVQDARAQGDGTTCECPSGSCTTTGRCCTEYIQGDKCVSKCDLKSDEFCINAENKRTVPISSTDPAIQNNDSPLATVVGAAVGGVLVLFTASLVGVWWHRRRKRHANDHEIYKLENGRVASIAGEINYGGDAEYNLAADISAGSELSAASLHNANGTVHKKEIPTKSENIIVTQTDVIVAQESPSPVWKQRGSVPITYTSSTPTVSERRGSKQSQSDSINQTTQNQYDERNGEHHVPVADIGNHEDNAPRSPVWKQRSDQKTVEQTVKVSKMYPNKSSLKAASYDNGAAISAVHHMPYKPQAKHSLHDQRSTSTDSQDSQSSLAFYKWPHLRIHHRDSGIATSEEASSVAKGDRPLSVFSKSSVDSGVLEEARQETTQDRPLSLASRSSMDMASRSSLDQVLEESESGRTMSSPSASGSRDSMLEEPKRNSTQYRKSKISRQAHLGDSDSDTSPQHHPANKLRKKLKKRNAFDNELDSGIDRSDTSRSTTMQREDAEDARKALSASNLQHKIGLKLAGTNAYGSHSLKSQKSEGYDTLKSQFSVTSATDADIESSGSSSPQSNISDPFMDNSFSTVKRAPGQVVQKVLTIPTDPSRNFATLTNSGSASSQLGENSQSRNSLSGRATRDELIEQFKSAKQKYSVEQLKNFCFVTSNFAIGYFDSEGGLLALPDRSIYLAIPPGALDEPQDIYFSVEYQSDGGPSDNTIAYSPIIDCGPDNLKFQRKIYMSFQHCAPEKLAKNFQLVSKQDNDTHWSNAETEIWVKKDRVWLSVYHFTKYKIIHGQRVLAPTPSESDDHSQPNANCQAQGGSSGLYSPTRETPPPFPPVTSSPRPNSGHNSIPIQQVHANPLGRYPGEGNSLPSPPPPYNTTSPSGSLCSGQRRSGERLYLRGPKSIPVEASEDLSIVTSTHTLLSAEKLLYICVFVEWYDDNIYSVYVHWMDKNDHCLQVLQDEYTNKARSNPAEFLGKQDFCFSETDGDLHINIQKQHNCNVTNSATSEKIDERIVLSTNRGWKEFMVETNPGSRAPFCEVKVFQSMRSSSAVTINAKLKARGSPASTPSSSFIDLSSLTCEHPNYDAITALLEGRAIVRMNRVELTSSYLPESPMSPTLGDTRPKRVTPSHYKHYNHNRPMALELGSPIANVVPKRQNSGSSNGRHKESGYESSTGSMYTPTGTLIKSNRSSSRFGEDDVFQEELDDAAHDVEETKRKSLPSPPGRVCAPRLGLEMANPGPLSMKSHPQTSSSGTLSPESLPRINAPIVYRGCTKVKVTESNRGRASSVESENGKKSKCNDSAVEASDTSLDLSSPQTANGGMYDSDATDATIQAIEDIPESSEETYPKPVHRRDDSGADLSHDYSVSIV